VALMRIVVTGGSGFLGSHLCEALIARGDEVVCVDNFCTSSRENVQSLIGSDRFSLVEADAALKLPVAGHVDAVAHLASPASPADYLRLPLATLAVGSRGTEAALDLAEANDARFVVASTSEIYGEPLIHPQVETYWGNVNPIGPRSVYDEAKRFAEALTSARRRVNGTRTGIVRIFNTYGPRMRPEDGRVISSFLAQALGGTALTIFGDGTQTRSFCFVDDLVRGFVAMIDSDESGPINLGSPDEHAISEVAELVLKLSGSSSGIEWLPLPADDPTRRRPDISLAKQVLRWQPHVELEDGLKRTIEWLRQRSVAAG
jgi:dTDP-glucose 4,6-dehydratase